MKCLGIPVHWALLPPRTCPMLSIGVIQKLLLSVSRLLCIHKAIPSENPKLLFPSVQILTGLCSLKTVENEWSCQIQKAALSLTTHTDGRVIMRVQHFSLEFFGAYILTFLCQPFHPPILPLISLPLCPSVLSLLGSRQEEGPGGDQGLHHPVSGQCGLPDQCLS